MGNKVGLITPFLMLLAGAVASVIMYIKGYSLYRMSWGLLIVLLIFYVIGDIVRYLYSLIRPRIIPNIDVEGIVMRSDDSDNDKDKLKDSMDALGQENDAFEESAYSMDSVDGMMSEEGYSEETLADYAEGNDMSEADENQGYEEDMQDDGYEGYESEEYEEPSH